MLFLQTFYRRQQSGGHADVSVCIMLSTVTILFHKVQVQCRSGNQSDLQLSYMR